MRYVSTFAALCAVALLSLSCANAGEGRIRVLQTLTLPDRVGDVNIQELSGLAFDPSSSTLWAVSDEGELRGFFVRYDGTSVSDISLAHAFDLDHELKNAEGLEFVIPPFGEIEKRLFVAYEDGPAVVSFAMTGNDAKIIALPQPLSMQGAYAEDNSRLESISVDADGAFMTAPEEALANRPDTEHEIYHSDGRIFKFPTFQPHRSNLKALEHLTNGNILILERTRDDAGSSTMRLRLLESATCHYNTMCKVTELVPDIPDAFIGNFEGLTQLKGNMFAAVTDSKTKKGKANTLVIFELIK